MEPLEVKICMNTKCMMLGAMDIMDQIETLNDVVDDLNLRRGIEVEAVADLPGATDSALCPVVEVGGQLIQNASTESVMSVILDQTEGGQYK